MLRGMKNCRWAINTDNFLHSVSAIYYEYDTKIQDDMDTIKELLKQNNFTIFSEVKDERVKDVFNMLSTKDIN